MKGLGKGPTVRSKEPWQVCGAGTDTALAFPVSFPLQGKFKATTTQSIRASTSFPRGLAGGVVTPYGSGAVLQAMVALGCSLPSLQRLCPLSMFSALFPVHGLDRFALQPRGKGPDIIPTCPFP